MGSAPVLLSACQTHSWEQLGCSPTQGSGCCCVFLSPHQFVPPISAVFAPWQSPLPVVFQGLLVYLCDSSSELLSDGEGTDHVLTSTCCKGASAEHRTRPLPPAHPNTSGNAHGQSDSTLRAGEEKQVMRQQMKAEVGHSWWPQALGLTQARR